MRDDDNTPMGDAQAIIDTAQVAMFPMELEPGKYYAIRDRDGLHFEDTTSHLDRPPRLKRNVTTFDTTSFITYIVDHRADNLDDHPEIYANDQMTGAGRPGMVCVFDPHGWREDRVWLNLTPSPEWEAWTSINTKLLQQAGFAEFVENHLSSIVTPEGAVLLEICQSMEATTKVDWKSAEWLQNGERTFKYSEQIEAKAGRDGKLTIPAQFTLALRPFLGAEPFEVKANLRYRITNGDLTIGFKLVEPERRLEVALQDVTVRVREATGVTVLLGKP